MKEVVTFFLSGKEYGADVSKIQGIENYVEYAKEPGLSDGFLGIVSIRDEWVPLLNLKKKLVLPPVPVTGETKYLVFQLPQGKAAVLVDGVSNIIQADGDEIQDFPALVHTKRTANADFVVNHKGRLILSINPESLLTKEEWQEVDKVLKSKSEESNEE